eukprot:g1079.t1
MMPPFLNFYLAEKRGNLEQLINVFSAQRRYLERYIPSISAMTIDDNFESAHWICHSVFAGAETAHFFPFRSNLMRGYKLADITDVQDFRERFDRWPIIVGMKRGGFVVSPDGLHHCFHADVATTHFFATLALAQNLRNVISKARAGRLLGRLHAALGEHALSLAALDAALATTKLGKLLFSESLTVRARVLVGKAATADATGAEQSSAHWDMETEMERLQEVIGRMDGGRQGLLEKLLLHGVL